MTNQFQLFQTPIKLAHSLWEQLLKPGDLAIDATCGNGYDTIKLASLCASNESGSVLGFDIQEEAISSTKKKIPDHFIQQIELHHMNHLEIDQLVTKESAKLIVYNLGYLPGGDKSITTKTDDTLESIKRSLPLIQRGGAISITCYPGHDEGLKEQGVLLDFASTLKAFEWCSIHHTWLNRKKGPTLLFLEKSSTPAN